LALAYAAWKPQVIRGLFLRSSFFGAVPELARYMAPWPDWLGEVGCNLLGEAAVALQRLLCHGETVLCEAGASSPSYAALAQDAQLAAVWAAFDAGQSAPGGVLASRARWQPGSGGASPDALWDWQIFLHQAQQGWGVGPAGVTWPSQAPGPVWLVHGQADAVCDPKNSARLAAAWPQAHHVPVAGGAHAMSHPPMAAALQQAAIDWVAALVTA
jgi:pimeloyl-ACP methyl ester carboxylesterase